MLTAATDTTLLRTAAEATRRALEPESEVLGGR
jgi:hypothetical protein